MEPLPANPPFPSAPFPASLLIAMGIIGAMIVWFGLGYVSGNHTSAAYHPCASTITLTVAW